MDGNGFDLGPLAPVAMETLPDGWTLVFTRDLRHPPERVWAALTEPERLRDWAPYTADRDLGSTGPATLTMLDAGGSIDLPGTVSRAESPRLLEYTWGTDVLRWDLAGTGSGTRLTLRHTVRDPSQVAMVAAGWHLCLAVAERLLDGRPVAPIRGEAAREYGWERLRDAYAAELGPVDEGDRTRR
jgi:uncharacterized protein YndB with AHSA1/START domain